MARTFESDGQQAASMPLGARRPARSIRVLIADDHRILRETLRLLLELRHEVDVVGEADDGREAVDMAERLKPDVVLMDMGMPALNGIEATQLIRRRLPRTRVLMLSGYDQDDRVTAALRAGAAGYVVKNAPVEELLKAIQQVSQSGTYLSTTIADRAGERDGLGSVADPAKREPVLTAREREVLQLVAEGHSNKGIAERLFISPKTVEAHKEHIVRKLGIRGSAELIHYAIRKGLIFIETDSQIGLAAGPS
ncbi:MAG TPA: response regulator transcription factor [Dehalococcoidia bacterium]|nr:response regulator transcription factor [Dehalococcoidia bacterium]